MAGWPHLVDIAAQVKSGKTSAISMVEQALELAEKNKEYQFLISTLPERAKSRAEQIDEMVSNGQDPGRLAGVPFIAKDNFLTFTGKTTAASNILKPFEAPYQSSAIEKLEAEGAICIGKSNLDAFAHGSSTENSDWFVSKNPHDNTRVPGGSSGGSAVAVALQVVPFALGTDTGGSIRLPASFSGTVGYKPTYGLVSRSGVIAMASSTDVIGPLAMNIDDTALVLDVMAGKDKYDSTTIDRDPAGYLPEDINLKSKKIGIVKEYMEQGLQPEVKTTIEQVIEKLKAAGAELSEVSLPSLPLALAVYYIVCPAEVSSNLSRYDGQRYGYFDPAAANLDDSYELSRSGGFGAEAKRRIMIGTYVLSSGYYDAYYKKAQIVRTKIIKEYEQAFADYDFLIGPTSPTTAFKIGENSSDPLKMYLTDIMTVAANMSGVPSISLPAGLSPDGLPVGVQLVAAQGNDKQLLSFSKSVEGII